MVEVTRLNASDLRLVVERVDKPVYYSCILRKDSRIILSEHIRVDITDVPGPPRNLDVQSTNSNGGISITWTAPDTDNGSPLMGYYINVTVEGTNSTVTKVLPDTTNLDYLAKCVMINVTVTSENGCGNSTAIKSGIDTKYQCGKCFVSLFSWLYGLYSYSSSISCC